jgi:uncharacterized tellurite resistance protein B-like protein
VDNPCHSALLHLTHLLITADGTIDDHEVKALELIQTRENISKEFVNAFIENTRGKKERELFQAGMESISQCTDEEKLRVFVILYKLAEVDGRVHLKEIKLLLYALRLAKIEFEEVVTKALASPSLL